MFSLALVRPSWAVGVEEQQAGQIQKMMDALVALPLAIEMRGHFVPGLPCFKQPSGMFTPTPWLRLAWLCIWRSFPATQLFWKLHCDLSWAIRIHWRFKTARWHSIQMNSAGAYSGEKWQGRINEGSLCGTWWEDWWSASHVRAGFLPAWNLITSWGTGSYTTIKIQNYKSPSSTRNDHCPYTSASQMFEVTFTKYSRPDPSLFLAWQEQFTYLMT